MKLNTKRGLTKLAGAAALLAMAGCGGGGSGGEASDRGPQEAQDGIKHAAAASTAANTLTVRARADLAGTANGPATYKQGAFMVIIADGKVVNSVEVRATSYQDYTFTLPSVAAGTKLDVVYNNDLDTARGQDRNLFIESITVNGQTIAPTAPGVTFDRATADKATAFDGIDVLPGTGALWWNGALRFTLGAGTSAASNMSPACAAFYDARPGFQLDATRGASVVPMGKPARGVAVEEANFKTCLVRASDFAADGQSGRIIHAYSRRQAFNADSTMYVALSLDGYSYVYDAKTHKVLLKLESSVLTPHPAGDQAELQWDATKPNLFTYLSGSKIYEFDMATKRNTLVADFFEKLKSKWPTLASVRTGSEGSPSKDGNYHCYMAQESGGSGYKYLGIFTWDRKANAIVGTYQSPDNALPDHVSMSPSGNYCVQSGYAPVNTVAFSRDFSGSFTVSKNTTHYDLAVDANGDDVFIGVDPVSWPWPNANAEGDLFIFNLRTRERTNLGINAFVDSSSAMHFSGRALNKPGWFVLSTQIQNPQNKWLDSKVMAVELKANPTVYNLAFHRTRYLGQEYQAPVGSANRDFTKVIFNSNWGSATGTDMDAYTVEIPPGLLVSRGGATTPTTPPATTPSTPTTPPAGALSITVSSVTHSGYDAGYVLKTSEAALCRATWTAGNRYADIYDDIPASADGLTHTKSLSLPGTGAQKVYAACKAKGSAAEAQVTIDIP